MAALRRTNREIEVKLRVAGVRAMIARLHSIGARYLGRVLEQNTLYDTSRSDFRRRGCLLRLRVETPAPVRGLGLPSLSRRHPAARTVLTSKAPAPVVSARASRYKEKLERELVVRNPRLWPSLLRSLGLRPSFRYEKYRATFHLRRLQLDLDETPAGNFLELEGAPKAIDRAARALGYSPRDYCRGTYWDVYSADCRRRGQTPRNMLFSAKKSR